jgi:nitrogen fixation protein NifU and related proteins
MADLGALYQRSILEHSRNPRNFGPLLGASHRARRDNPFCGDEITVSLELAGERIARIGFEGAGCAIALASSSMMAAALAGKTRAEAEALCQRFFRLVAGESVAGSDLGELAAFAGVARFPVRVQCARLSWLALLAAFDDAIPR